MLTKTVAAYLGVRRAMGFHLKNVERLLKSFANFAEAKGDTHIVAKTAIDWAKQSHSEAYRATRLNAVIQLAHYCKAEDSRHEIPPCDVFCGRRHRSMPYIYSDDEIRAIMNHALKIKPVGSLRPQVYSTLIGLLATTGLRISEALRLRLGDVTRDGLLILQTKYRKSRLIPLHHSTSEALSSYLTKRRRLCTEDDHIFVSQNNGPLSTQSVYTVFHRLLKDAEISGTLGRLRPRLIDFRHTFATRALSRCMHNRDHIGQHMLALTTYLGHAHVGCTYWYLESTPQLMQDISEECMTFLEEELS